MTTLRLDDKCSLLDDIEKYIIKHTHKTFRRLTDEELNKVRQKVTNKFHIDISTNIISSINSSYIKNFIIEKYYRVNKYKNRILSMYPNYDIIKISKKYGISPMTIMKIIIENKYHKNLSEVNNSNVSEIDFTQFKIASNYDNYYQLNQQDVSKESKEFEIKIEDILKKHDIKYQTQDDLVIEQTKIYGKPINTPDFLIKSDLIINDKKVNWIDAKNFYGSKTKFVINRIKKQIKKYISSYGTGCIIFNYGYNSLLSFDNVLILCYESLK
jgi:hypothetical protein